MWLTVRMFIFRCGRRHFVTDSSEIFDDCDRLGCWFFAAVRSTFCHRVIQISNWRLSLWQIRMLIFRGVSDRHFVTDVIQRSVDESDWQLGCWRRGGQQKIDICQSVQSLWRRLSVRVLFFSRRSGTEIFVTDWLSEIFDDWLTVRMLIFRGGKVDIFVTDSCTDLWRLIGS